MSEIIVNESWDMANLSLEGGKFNSGESSASRFYIVEGTNDEREAIKKAYDFAPDNIYENDSDSLPKKQASMSERCGEDKWKVQVEYGFGTDSSPDGDDDAANKKEPPEVCFQVSTSTIKVLHAYDQICIYKRQGADPLPTEVTDIPIGWNGKTGSDSQAEGVDVPFPECREQYRRILSYEKVRDIKWRRRVALCVGKVNMGKFKGWNTGEVMFMGASYDTPQRGVKNVKVTFDFLIRPNEDKIKVAGHTINEELLGHDYHWAVIGEKKTEKSISPQLNYVFKCRVVKFANFDTLGL